MATIGLAGYILSPTLSFAEQPKHRVSEISPAPPKPADAPKLTLVSGKPTRIVIPDYAIDLPIDEGIYANDGSWTLSETHAQFAVMTAWANNHAGNTFVYGHGTNEVFGKLASTAPTPATTAQLYTDNGQVFSYRFQESHNLAPDDTGILDDTASGPPRLTVQTCTGVWNEWRTMFVFAFDAVKKDRQ